MKRILIIMTMLIGLTGLAAYAATPQQALQACVNKLKGAKSAKVEFGLTSQGRTVSGTLLIKGSKFAVTSGSNGTWYDGRDMWVYTPSSGEVTVWKPAQSELAEANPFMYLSTAGDYTVAAGNGGSKGENVLLLTPKKRSSGIKSIRLVLNGATSLPKRMEITSGSGNVNLNIRNLQLGAAVGDGSFTFPRSKYPRAKITDLR